MSRSRSPSRDNSERVRPRSPPRIEGSSHHSRVDHSPRRNRSRSPPRRFSRSPPRRHSPRRRSASPRRSIKRSRSPPLRGNRPRADERTNRNDDAEWERRFGKEGKGRDEGPRRKMPRDLPNPFLNKNVKESEMQWGKKESPDADPSKKEKANFSVSGALNKGLNVDERTGIELKYIEPEDGGMPIIKWRLYPFKENASLEPYPLYRKSYYLMGRDRHVADIPLDHPSCSKQHAVIQHKKVHIDDPIDGGIITTSRPYIMDLGSVNGTFLNGVKVEPMRYIELIEKDILKFGSSSREFVLLHEESY